MKIDIKKIRIDGGTQPRSNIDDNLVNDYAEAMQSGVEFPPVVVFHDGVDYWLADGFHRTHAARRILLSDIDADIKQGTKRDAVLYSVGANSDHGLRRSNADKRKAVMTLLEDAEWSRWSNVEIARHCAVSDMTVKRIRDDLSPQQSGSDEPSRTYTTKHGTTATMNTANIGRKESQQDDERVDVKPVIQDRPQRRGEGLRYAHEAISVLKRIPANDQLREDALNTVADWINTNRG